MKLHLAVAVAALALAPTLASAQMIMDNSGRKMTQQQMNDMAKMKPIPGAGYVSPPSQNMNMNMSMGGNMGMSSGSEMKPMHHGKMMHHGKKMKMKMKKKM